MRDFATFRTSAIRYWERRRLVYNLLLVPPALFGYFTATELSVAVGDHSYVGILGIGLLFLVAAIGANVCYSTCYSLEFVFGSDEASSAWLRFGRRVALIAGIIFAMMLAVVGGRNIGLLEYQMHRASVDSSNTANPAVALFHWLPGTGAAESLIGIIQRQSAR